MLLLSMTSAKSDILSFPKIGGKLINQSLTVLHYQTKIQIPYKRCQFSSTGLHCHRFTSQVVCSIFDAVSVNIKTRVYWFLAVLTHLTRL